MIKKKKREREREEKILPPTDHLNLRPDRKESEKLLLRDTLGCI